MSKVVRDYPSEIKEYCRQTFYDMQNENAAWTASNYDEDKNIGQLISYMHSKEGGIFWSDIQHGKYDTFYQKYPQENKDPFKLINCVKSGSTVIYYGKVKGRKVKIEITYE